MAKLLVADDDTAILHLFTRHLKARGHDVLCAADGIQAMAILEKEDIAVLIADVRMPGMDGLALAARVRALSRRVGVLLISGAWTPDARDRAAALGCSHLRQKPVDLEQVAGDVEDLLARPAGGDAGSTMGVRVYCGRAWVWFADEEWLALLDAARLHGWTARGAVTPADAPEDWTSAYWPPCGQRIEDADRVALAEALALALRPEHRSGPSGADRHVMWNRVLGNVDRLERTTKLIELLQRGAVGIRKAESRSSRSRS